MGKVKVDDTRPMGSSTSWSRTHGGYSWRACIDEADMTAAQMETKWGAGRVRLLVTPELREKFDGQRYLFNAAIWHGDLEAVRREAQRMVTAWLALDRAATAAGKATISPHVWEVALTDGTVAAIVPSDDHARAVMAEGRAVAVYTLDEIARFPSAYPDVARAKLTFPGGEVAMRLVIAQRASSQVSPRNNWLKPSAFTNAPPRYWELKEDKTPTSTPSSLEGIEAVLRDHGVIVFTTPTAGVRLATDVAAQRVIRDQN